MSRKFLNGIAGGPADLTFVVQTGTRVTGAGDVLVGFYVPRAFIAESITYQFGTADASGSTGVELRRNGTQVTSSNLTISAANQADGTGTDAARTAAISQAFSVGDRLLVQCTSLGTTPGKQLVAVIKGRYS